MIKDSTSIPTNLTTSVDDNWKTSASIVLHGNSLYQSTNNSTESKLVENPLNIFFPDGSYEHQ